MTSAGTRYLGYSNEKWVPEDPLSARALYIVCFICALICPYQLGNKCLTKTILNIWRNEKYFSILLTYQLFGYN